MKAGESVSVQAEILKLEGAGQEFSKLKGQTLEDSVYIFETGLVERSAEHPNGVIDLGIVILKPLEKSSVGSAESGVKIFFNIPKVTPVEAAKDYIFLDWKLPFNLPWWSWLILLAVLIVGGVALIQYPKWKAKKELVKKREELWKRVLEAQSQKDIMAIWNERLEYFQHFPDLEKNFRGWEKTIYPFIFKPQLNDDEVMKIQKSYKKFVSELPVRRNYGV